MFGHARHVLHVWDYHHGQATRVVVAGCPPLPGRTMAEKQAYLAEHYDNLRALVCREPRGHRNMLGAFVTDPVTPGSHAGVIFIHPDGYFDACGDSTFSVAVALVESGLVPREIEDGDLTLRLDTVLGVVPVRVTLGSGRVRAVTMESGRTFALGQASLQAEAFGNLGVELAWGGLLYAFVPAAALGIALHPLDDPTTRQQLLDAGTALWQAARRQLRADIPGIEQGRPVDLVTIFEDVDAHGQPLPPNATTPPAGARVANFYAPQTMGRTPSGTGTAAHVALLTTKGQLPLGTPYYHESPLGLRFTARAIAAGDDGVVSEISTMSYCMGIGTLVLRDDDPFPAGFTL
ncbi:MAG: proline racemase family protein [Thermorudis peleae]|nr:proline racemase family protein [Thermorudis peleae]